MCTEFALSKLMKKPNLFLLLTFLFFNSYSANATHRLNSKEEAKDTQVVVHAVQAVNQVRFAESKLSAARLCSQEEKKEEKEEANGDKILAFVMDQGLVKSRNLVKQPQRDFTEDREKIRTNWIKKANDTQEKNKETVEDLNAHLSAGSEKKYDPKKVPTGASLLQAGIGVAKARIDEFKLGVNKKANDAWQEHIDANQQPLAPSKAVRDSERRQELPNKASEVKFSTLGRALPPMDQVLESGGDHVVGTICEGCSTM
jgi:exopolysaccharide biosynthesis protein